MDFKIRLASKTILIHSLFSDVYYECSSFIEENTEPDFEISVDHNQLSAEFERLKQLYRNTFSLQAVESFLIQRMIAEAMLEYNTLLMHGAVVAFNNIAYLFTATSGTGKSTHIQKWPRDVKGSFIVNGDKPLVILDKGIAYACGTPWRGKEHWGNNAIIPLKGIVFMERSMENHIELVPFKALFPVLLEQTYQPNDSGKMKKRLELLLKLKECVSFYKFSFNNFKDDSVSVAYDALVNHQ